MGLFSGSVKETLLSQLNGSNTPPVPITADNLYFGKPHLDVDGVTTVIPVAGTLGAEYTGYSALRTQRLDLSKIFDTLPVMRSVGGLTLHDMLAQVNQYFGLNFTPNDVIDTNITWLTGGEAVNVNVKADPKSLGYVGSFIFQYYRIRPLLAKVVKQTTLNELHHIQDPHAPTLNLSMAMWGLDFTADRANLATNGKYWRSVANVQAVAALNGFPNWPAPAVNGVIDQATKDNPLANPAFDRVAIQKNVVVGSYAGDAYFHYNLN